MKKKHTKVILILVLLLVLTGGFYVYQVSSIQKNSEPVLFEVQEGGFNQVLHQLEEEGLIRSAFFTKIQAKIHGFGRVYVGTVEVDKADSSKKILEKLDNPDFISDDVTITLNEGDWAKHMAEKLSSVNGVSAQDYLDLWNNEVFLQAMVEKFDHIPQEIVKLKDVRVKLEGYLYPDTYRLSPKDSAETITETLLSNGANKFEEVKDLVHLSDLTQEELYTLASIVEYEASGDEDMRKVAGVFMNRIEADMALQSSVTVCYSLYEFDDWKECESAENNQIESPYNTYRYKGLPPGPILNPSIRALKATLDYDKNNYLFFIADVYQKEDGKVHYQETYAEHEVVRKKLLGY
ncbi:endolytic transglycosylase MltG [Erysipelothrix urinaevulpis]|uniref:endolytic transglycosylase MltG n=1 Tax=Erysipelothrix urinaevulpis TaxID=2683717 RepID=UPI0013568B4C|nr:endolytic transglycosylase MltG [Erysipelothrix urinaevulpis]